MPVPLGLPRSSSVYKLARLRWRLHLVGLAVVLIYLVLRAAGYTG